MNRARAVRTRLCVSEYCSALCATVAGFADNASGAALQAIATRSAALAPCREVRDHAVDRTMLRVAHTILVERSTLLATVAVLHIDAARA